MPPKGKDAKKGAVAGNFKAGKALKDILPATSKPPREGVIARMEGEPEVQRTYEFEPLEMLPEWPGNEAALANDFKAGFEQGEDGQWSKYTEPEAVNGVGELNLPPSFTDFTKGAPIWMRPEEYIKEIMYEKEVHRRRQEKKREFKLRKSTRKNSLMALAQNSSAEDAEKHKQEETELEQLKKTSQSVVKDELIPVPKVIASEERLETEAEVQKRKEVAEKAAAADKGAKKKAPPAKGAPVADPADEPQTVQIPIDGCLDMSFLMPKYTKWVTSQFQFIRDRTIRDVDSNESIWQRIYPQENGIPTISPTGKYWIKLRFMGKERLVEIDDRMPCSHKGMPILPRTTDVNEIWPQLLMKAILKVYSYKWFAANCQYDSEIGDGSLVYSLTGLIPEKVQVKDNQQAQELFRHYLSDEHYFGKKSYLTAYCENEFRPKFPSQNITNLGQISMTSPGLGKTVAFGEGPKQGQLGSTTNGNLTDGGFSETQSVVSSSSKMMLTKLKDAASLAISVTTGRKPAYGAKEKSLTNIIPGFGYALMDVFENEFVEMESIQKQSTQIVEENSSPFASPAKSRTKRDKSIGKDEHKKARKEQRKKEMEEFEKKERTPPAQYQFVKIKTSIGKHPVINYLSTFTNDEIQEGKKHLINKWRRDPSKPVVLPYNNRSPSPNKKGFGGANKFKIDINEVNNAPTNLEASIDIKTPSKVNRPVDTSNALLPKTRAAGGIWLTQSDFPHAFQNIIIYHNITKYSHNTFQQDIWSNAAEPYISNEKEVYFKLELDEEAIEKVKQQKLESKNIGIIQKMKAEESQEAEESKEVVEEETQEKDPLPGERIVKETEFDDIIMACAPYPTNKKHDVLPRYLTRIHQVDCQVEQAKEKNLEINQNFKSYFEGVKFKLVNQMADQKCIWLKPEFNCPQGSTIWIASQLRKISVLSKVEYLQEQKQFHSKQVTSDYLPQQAGKYQLFGKYEFNISEEDTILHMKVDMADKYLLDFMRMKIIDRSSGKTETDKQVIVNQMNVSEIKLKPNGDAGYYLVIEGVMPYNTADGQMIIDTLCNKESFALNEVTSCEPQEYVDAYVPTKYGIIFKEKIVISPTDNTAAAINIKLLKGGQEFSQVEGMTPKYFRVDVLDNGKKVHCCTGYNQITISHIMFRCNNGLPETLEEGVDPETEVKHNYVIQALFDLHEWPEGKTASDDSAEITWQIKMYSSETLALIKDTDKEDKEKALKAQWEADEPGRAEKAQISRQKFILKKKQQAGETLTEEELAIVNEKRERIRKKDQEDAAAKGGKGGKAPPAKGKGAPPPKGAPAAVEEEDESSKIVYPKAENHVNSEIKDFLDHFASSRKIILEAKESRKRDEEEKQTILDGFQSAMTAESDSFTHISQEREKMKEERQKEREEAFIDMDEFRSNYKTEMQSLIAEDREKYRGMIDGRKEKETTLLDLIRSEKADIAALTGAIESAQEFMVKPKYIKKGKKFLKFMEYLRDFEGMLQQAVVDKNKEQLQALLERVESESALMGNPIPIDAKILNDAKGNLAKMK